ncbi:transposase [Roseomonas ludipueritiae]|uniref:Transposase n=1 Tax=Pseudoroseomonas ludipueritiae TaxID=198093 RepID=A0ABR7R9Q6_9PROT|nr:transposase [Pseudoroseomonas ludipueritiae]
MDVPRGPHSLPNLITDLQWSALLPYLLPRAPQGRRMEEHRKRMEAIFFIATSTLPWCALPARYGKADTVSATSAASPMPGYGRSCCTHWRKPRPATRCGSLRKEFSAPAAARTASSACPSSCSSAASTCAAPCPARLGCCPIRFCPKPWLA